MTEGIKRFYTDVSVAEEDGLHTVRLDGRTARTVGRHKLGAASRPLADAIAEEWAGQEETVDLAVMPLTRLQGFALDGGEGARAEWTEVILNYAQSDLLCYRATDAGLAARQAELWQPPLDWLGQKVGAGFIVTEGIIPVEQPAAIGEGIARLAGRYAIPALLATKLMTEILGSAVLALSVTEGEMAPEQAITAARLDETYQEERWGVDAEAAERAARIRADFDTIVRYLSLSRSS